MAGVHALQAKAALLFLPGKKRLAGEKRGWVAARRDKLDLGYEHALGMLFAKEDRARHHRVQVGGAERAWKAPAFGAHEIDIGLAIDLRAAEKENVDSSLPREVEEFARAFAERIAAAPMQPRNAQAGILLFLQQCACGRYRRSRADGNMARLADETRYYAGKEFFALDQTNSSR